LKTNKQLADEFIMIVAADKDIKMDMIYHVKFRNKSNLTNDFDDFFHDTIMKCFNTIIKKGGDFTYPSDYKGYFYRALDNNYMEHQRKHKDYYEKNKPLWSENDWQTEYISTSTIEDKDSDFMVKHEEYNERIKRERLEDRQKETMLKYMNLLPDTLKEPLFLHYWDNKSYKDMSRILGISFNVVRNRMFTARQEVKKLMEHDIKNNLN
jgi:RNA polymerase sigma factor (sigma-70 family)